MSWLLFLAITLTAQAAPYRVMIDPGHGGKDRGAVVGAHRESEITLKVARKLHALLSQDKRFNANLTRDEDVFISLAERVRRSEIERANLFLSIHVNWSPDKAAHGVEIYFQNQLPPDEESMYLAARENNEESESSHAAIPQSAANPEVNLIVQDLMRNQRIFASSQLAKHLKKSWQGSTKNQSMTVRQAPFHVISKQTVPSALVEIGFLTHPMEGPRLVQDSYLDVIAQSLHEGIIAFYEGMDKVVSPRLQ